MPLTNQLKNQHLLWRAGFGPMAGQADQLNQTSQEFFLKDLFKTSAKQPEYIEVADNSFQGLMMGIDDASKQKKQLSPEQKKQLREQSRKEIKNLNLTWLNEMVNSEQQLREKMSLFWHGHFASRNLNILYQQQLLHVIRSHSLGSFKDLLREVSKSAAMINFLNNNQNRKGHPNENFAREVMELFTIGRGNYSENDVKEAARAFTGWGANMAGEFVFRRGQHDEGRKTFMNRSGNFNGDEVLDILLEQKQTARFITAKIYTYFVNEKPAAEKIEWLSNRFYQGNYNITLLMNDIFSSDWFCESKNIGTKIKSPIELLVGIRRILPMQIENEEVQLLIQRLLGQLLFYPPNVAGWPGGKNWIDSSSLMLRLRIPQLIAAEDSLIMNPKADDDQMMGIKDQVKTKNLKAMGAQVFQGKIDWNLFVKNFQQVPREKLISEIGNLLLQTASGFNTDLINKYSDAQSRENFIRTATIRVMSLPEYQLC